MKNFYFSLIIVLSCGLVACEPFTFAPVPAQDPETIFETLWQDFAQHYAPFEERGVNWDALYAELRPQITAHSTADQLYTILQQLLTPLNDGHVKLSRPNSPVFIANRILNEYVDDALFSLELIKSRYLQVGFQEGEEASYVYGLLPQQLIYVHLPWISDNFRAVAEAIEAYPEASGLILDLRHNEGGDFTYCFSDMDRFTTEKRLVFQSKTKNGPGKEDYTAWHEWYIFPGNAPFAKPVMVLTDRYTISAAERTVMAFMTLPNVTVLGDTTCGAHSTMIGRELPNGWHYTLATQKVQLPDGLSYEGIGLAPDVYVVNSPDEMQVGIDQTLERAMQEILP